MKKIICPVDFSTVSLNAAEYAAQVAQLFNADLLFVNVQALILSTVLVDVGAGTGSSPVSASVKLKKLCGEMSEKFNVRADYEVTITTRSFIKTLSELGTGKTMIVMGTNGADDLYRYFFGTNSYQVIRKTACPVLLVPQGVVFKAIRKVVFAWDYQLKGNTTFSLLEDTLRPFHPHFILLHVSRRKTPISCDVFRAIREEVESYTGEDNCDVDFEHAYSTDIAAGMHSYMIESKANMLALTYYDRGLVGNLFHGNVAKQLSASAIYPVLVVHN